LLSESAAGAKGFALGLNITKAGGMSPMHTHESQQEAMYFISGKGKIMIGNKEYDIAPDTVVLAPAGVPHELRNTGNEDIKFVWIYCPPLPEQK
jgi:mannose-6-phosphate isomerase-like protein (cupin superfamily)